MTWDKVTDDRIAKLHPLIREDAETLINKVEDQLEIRLRITQGLRTFDEQHALFMQPRDGKDNDRDGKIDEPDEKVTNADAGDSFHNYGLALDVVEIKNSQVNWNTRWMDIARIAKAMGFEWGGDFKSLRDKPHFQKSFGYTVKQLKGKPKNGPYPVL
ncbi:MAG: M15 family metallopeptidase [Bacteroidales bacterium]